MRATRSIVVGALLSMVLAIPPSAAQSPVDHRPFLLGVSARDLPEGARAMVVRTANGAQEDLIILAPDASARHTLVSAVALLEKARADTPNPSTTEVHSLTLGVVENTLPDVVKARHQAELERVRGGELRTIPGIGEVRVVRTSIERFH